MFSREQRRKGGVVHGSSGLGPRILAFAGEKKNLYEGSSAVSTPIKSL